MADQFTLRLPADLVAQAGGNAAPKLERIKDALAGLSDEALGSTSKARLQFADPAEAARPARPVLGRPCHLPTIGKISRVRELVAAPIAIVRESWGDGR